MASIFYLIFFVLSFSSWMQNRVEERKDVPTMKEIRELRASNFIKVLSVIIIEVPQIVLALYWISVLPMSTFLIATTTLFVLFETLKMIVSTLGIISKLDDAFCDAVKVTSNHLSAAVALLNVIGWVLLFI